MEIKFNVEFTQNDNFNVDFGEGVKSGDYTGPYEVTPSEETQMLPTTNRTLESSIVINPIPSNYGLITWNGSFITVS